MDIGLLGLGLATLGLSGVTELTVVLVLQSSRTGYGSIGNDIT
jgi:hypothetical protein